MASVSIDSLAYLPPEIKDLLKEVVFTCMHNSSGICSAVIEIISEVNRDPKGAELLSQMLSSGRLKGWLQGIVTNSVESKLRALEIVEDFKYLLGTAAAGADEVFEKVSTVSERQIKSQTKDKQSSDQGLQELSNIVKVLHSNYQRGATSESSFSNIDKYDSQVQIVPIQQVLAKYGTEPATIKHQEPLRTSVLPTIEMVFFKYPAQKRLKNKKLEEDLSLQTASGAHLQKQEPAKPSIPNHQSAVNHQTAKQEIKSVEPERPIASKELSNTGQSKSSSSLGGSTQTDSKPNFVTQIQIGVVENNQRSSKVAISKEDLMKPLEFRKESPKKPKQSAGEEQREELSQMEEPKAGESKPTISVLAPKGSANHGKQEPENPASHLAFEPIQPNSIAQKKADLTRTSDPSTKLSTENQLSSTRSPQAPAGPARPPQATTGPQEQRTGGQPPESPPQGDQATGPKVANAKEASKKRNSKHESTKKEDSFEYQEENPRKNSNNKFDDSFGANNASFDKSNRSHSKDKKKDNDSFDDPGEDKKLVKEPSADEADSFYSSDHKQADKADRSKDETELEKLDRSNASLDKPQFGTPDRKKDSKNTLGIKTPEKVQSKFEDSFYSAGSEEKKKAEAANKAPAEDTIPEPAKLNDSFEDGSDDLSFGSDEPKPQKKPSGDNYDFDEDLDFLREQQQEEENRRKEEKRRRVEEENRKAEERRRLEEEKIKKAVDDRKRREEEQQRREREAQEEERRALEKKQREAEEARKRLLREEDERKKKEYLEILDVKKKDVQKTPQQLALKLGRTVQPLPDQGRKYRPKKFEMPSIAVAKSYLSDFSLARIELPESSPGSPRRTH